MRVQDDAVYKYTFTYLRYVARTTVLRNVSARMSWLTTHQNRQSWFNGTCRLAVSQIAWPIRC